MVQTQSADLTGTDINPAWKKFLRNKVNSFIKWDLVRFFHDNPHTADTAEHIAQFVGRDGRTVARELEGLVRAEVLEVERKSGVSIYRLSRREDVRQLVTDFVSACHNREFRMKAINHVMHGMGPRTRHGH